MIRFSRSRVERFGCAVCHVAMSNTQQSPAFAANLMWFWIEPVGANPSSSDRLHTRPQGQCSHLIIDLHTTCRSYNARATISLPPTAGEPAEASRTEVVNSSWPPRDAMGSSNNRRTALICCHVEHVNERLDTPVGWKWPLVRRTRHICRGVTTMVNLHAGGSKADKKRRNTSMPASVATLDLWRHSACLHCEQSDVAS